MGYVHVVSFSCMFNPELALRSSDQFCSLVFTLSHLYFTFCAYAHNFPSDVFQRCGPQTHVGWSVQFALAVLPFVVRLVQSIRRYADSKLITHLINVSGICLSLAMRTDSWGIAVIRVGSTGVASYIISATSFGDTVVMANARLIYWPLIVICTRCWRPRSNFRFVVSLRYCLLHLRLHLGESTFCCLVITISWHCFQDFLMDWSFFKPHSRYPLLRSDLAYTNEIPVRLHLTLHRLVLIVILLYSSTTLLWLVLHRWFTSTDAYNIYADIKFTNQVHLGILYTSARPQPDTKDVHRCNPGDAETMAVEFLYVWCAPIGFLLAHYDQDRLENEHIGNTDQYRVTREVPLPYSFDDAGHDEEDDDGDEDAVSRRKWLHRRPTYSTNLKPVTSDGSVSHIWRIAYISFGY